MPIKFSIKIEKGENGDEPAGERLDHRPGDGGQNIGGEHAGAERPGRLGRVYRRIWLFFVAGCLSFFPVAWFASEYRDKAKSIVYSPYIWLFAIPAAFIIYAVYTSARYWRCRNCGAFLPTDTFSSRELTCRSCGQPLDF
jgi:hypothetical protein